jgi:hypothetical protein
MPFGGVEHVPDYIAPPEGVYQILRAAARLHMVCRMMSPRGFLSLHQGVERAVHLRVSIAYLVKLRWPNGFICPACRTAG